MDLNDSDLWVRESHSYNETTIFLMKLFRIKFHIKVLTWQAEVKINKNVLHLLACRIVSTRSDENPQI